jgi:hypothetical protein
MSKNTVKDLVRKGTISAVSLGLIGIATSTAFSADVQRGTIPTKIEQGAANVRQATLNQASLAALTNNLFSSPAERQKFQSNPKGYSEAFLGGKLDPASVQKLGDIQQRIGAGWCCAGCGCGQPAKPVDARTMVK